MVSEAIDRIASDYYRPIAKSRLTNGSISGAVASLGDRFSHYLSPKEFREFNAAAELHRASACRSRPAKRGLRVATRLRRLAGGARGDAARAM